MSGSPPQKTIPRQELYDQVWETPVSRLCRQYGVYDAVLRKMCREHRIPLPDASYWARKRLGQAVTRTPLVPSCDPKLMKVTITKTVRPKHAPTPPAPPPVFDEEIQWLLDQASKLPPIRVPDSLKKPHRLIEATRVGMDKSRPDAFGLLRPWGPGEHIAIHVSRNSVRRALCVLDVLFKAVEALGGKVFVDGDRYDARTYVSFGGERGTDVRISESYSRKPHVPLRGEEITCLTPRYDYVHSGCLMLSGFGYGHRESWPGDIDNWMSTFLSKLIEDAGHYRIQRLKQERDRRRAEDLERRRQALAEKQRKEQARVKELRLEAAHWNESQAIRAYLAAVRANIPDMENGSALDVWLRWADQQADRLDPLTPSPPSILDEPMP